jgi:AhpD family alkylhydroperoxidase
MLRDSGVTKAEREMIVVAVAGANDCLYCFIAHGAILRIYAKNPLVADQVGVNYRKADITPRQRAMLAFALKVAERSGEIDEADYAALREHGFDDEDIWDIGNISAFFCLSNRMANLISLRPNDEFYLWVAYRRRSSRIGRVPSSRLVVHRSSVESFPDEGPNASGPMQTCLIVSIGVFEAVSMTDTSLLVLFATKTFPPP